MTPADQEALTPVLRAVATVILSRRGEAGAPCEVDRLVEQRTPVLLSALEEVPWLRRKVAEELERTRTTRRAESLATLLLHPDDAVVGAALGWLSPGRPVRDRAAQKITDLRNRLDRAEGRLEYARKDVEELRRRLAETEDALAEQEERAARLEQRQAAGRARWKDPRAVAAALVSTLEQVLPVTEGDAATRDPRNTALTPTPTAHNEHLTAAARSAGLPPETLLRILRTVVDPAPPPPAAVTRELDLRVVPLGGGTEIGGSCLLVEAGGTRILVDAGLRPGDRSEPPRDIKRALDGPLHGVVVTHAHNDHCGYLPALIARRPDLRVLATPETVQLMPVMWADTVKVMRGRDRDRARWGDATANAHYRARDVEVAVRRCEEVPFGASRRIGELTVELFPAGHILGAVGVVVHAGGRRVVISGDISGFRQESVDGYTLPDSARNADLLVMESTCCAEDHGDRDTRVGDLVRAVQEVYDGGGRALIPAFALGRAQELALLMRRHLPYVPVRIDGMAADLATLFETATAGTGRPVSVFGGETRVAERPTELDSFRNGVIISTSGMLTGGPVVQWARRVLSEPGSALFISGYQDEEAPGRRLLDLAQRGGGDFALVDHGKEVTVPVRARVATMRLSAHADRRGLLEIADEAAAHRVMLVHGLPGRQQKFGDLLRMHGHKVVETAAWHAR